MSAPTRPILVTGAFGNVGRATLRALLEERRAVVATDLPTAANRRAAAKFEGLEVHFADLTDPRAVAALVAATNPMAVLHLAAVIPPKAYRDLSLARRVNVEATRHLVEALTWLSESCRLVFASSVAVYGSRNPHSSTGVDADTALRPREVYGAHKVESERIVTSSVLDWTVLRLGVVTFHDMPLLTDPDALRLEALLPIDGHVHSVDGRDVARALVRAVDGPCSRRILLVAGDESHRMTQRGYSAGVTAAVGLGDVLPPGRQGDPRDDDGWFNVDWMETAEAQSLLDFQQHDWSRTLDDLRSHVGALRHLLPAVRPLARGVLNRKDPYQQPPFGLSPHGPASPWEAIGLLWGAGALVNR